jgi:glycosyltransferase involved in cell wall biosynthesis
MSEKPRVALFAPYGYLAICASVVNAAIVWESHGYGVDIFVPESSWDVPSFDGADIMVHEVPMGRGGRLSRHAFAVWSARLARGQSFIHAIGYDQPGLSAAALVAKLSGCCYSYHSLELWLGEELRGLRDRLDKALEVRLARRASLTIAQDGVRRGLLVQDLRLDPNRTALVPNTPLGVYGGSKSPYLRERFGIDDDMLIVLQSGSLIEEHMCVESIDSVADWPEGYELVVHGWAPEPEYRARILHSAARVPERVHVCFDVLPVDAVDGLYASADVGLALYASPSQNFASIGSAAGKVFRFMRVGVPVVAQDLPGLSCLVRDTGSGVLVGEPAAISEALESVRSETRVMGARAKEAFSAYEFGGHYSPLVNMLAAVPCESRRSP